MKSKALCRSVFIYSLFTYCFQSFVDLQVREDRQAYIDLKGRFGVRLWYSIAECLLGVHCNISMSAKSLGDTVRVTN